MPFIKLDTNVTLSKEVTKIEDENFMTFGGSDAPCAMVDVAQFGSENKEAYGNLTAAICEKVGPLIGVDAGRI